MNMYQYFKVALDELQELKERKDIDTLTRLWARNAYNELCPIIRRTQGQLARIEVKSGSKKSKSKGSKLSSQDVG